MRAVSHFDGKGRRDAGSGVARHRGKDSVRTAARSWEHGPPPRIGQKGSRSRRWQIYNRGTMPTMLAKLKSGQSIDQVIAWAADELEGFAR